MHEGHDCHFPYKQWGLGKFGIKFSSSRDGSCKAVLSHHILATLTIRSPEPEISGSARTRQALLSTRPRAHNTLHTPMGFAHLPFNDLSLRRKDKLKWQHLTEDQTSSCFQHIWKYNQRLATINSLWKNKTRGLHVPSIPVPLQVDI